MSKELIDVQIRCPKVMEEKITALGLMCGLTCDQMASAIFILSQQGFIKDEQHNTQQPA